MPRSRKTRGTCGAINFASGCEGTHEECSLQLFSVNMPHLYARATHFSKPAELETRTSLRSLNRLPLRESGPDVQTNARVFC